MNSARLATVLLSAAIVANVGVRPAIASTTPAAAQDTAAPAAMRDYGTPTAAPGKVCPFTGDVPVEVPTAALPFGTSLPGTGGITLPGPSVPSTIYGELCMTTSTLAAARKGKSPAILVLVHGITYGTWYWDLPYQPERYSAVNYLTQHGYATLNIDRLGEGRSGHPASALVTSATNAEVVHQLVQKLKRGAIGGLTFPHIGLVGHSYGTISNWGETQRYNDVDVNIGTGYTDGVNGFTAGAFVAQSGPASASPFRAGHAWAADPGYLQPTPGTRGLPQLYNKADADPAVIALNEKLANTVTGPELISFAQDEYNGSRKNITTPTFLINGERDIMVCGDDADRCETAASQSDKPAELEKAAQKLQNWQGPSMNPEACFRSAVVPDAAHDINLHRNARQLYESIAYFADQAMGIHGQNADSYRASCQKDGGLAAMLPSPMTPGFSPPPADGLPTLPPAALTRERRR